MRGDAGRRAARRAPRGAGDLARAGRARLLPRPTNATTRFHASGSGLGVGRVAGGRRRRRRLLAAASARALALLRRRRRACSIASRASGPASWNFSHQSARPRAASTSPLSAAQHQEIEAGAEARVLEQAERPLPDALLEARLQRPDFLHRRLKRRGIASFSVCASAPVHRREQRRHRLLALRPWRASRRQHFVPQQRGEQEGGRNRLVLRARARRCWPAPGRRSARPAAAPGSRRAAAARRGAGPLAQRAHASSAWPDSSSFCISSNSRAGGHVLRAAARASGSARAVFGSISKPELGREAHGAQHAHRVLAVARVRVADHAQPPGADVGDAAEVVPDVSSAGS